MFAAATHIQQKKQQQFNILFNKKLHNMSHVQ